MEIKDFIESLKTICKSIEESRGPVNLFAVLKMDELTDKWTVVISAAWIDNNTFESLFTELRNLLLKHAEREMPSIARIGIFDLDNHLSELMIERYATGHYIKSDEQINGNLVHEGYVIQVIRPEV